MKFVKCPSFRRDDSLVQLGDFLSTVPENNWMWVVLDFYGIGNAPNDLSMDDFEKLVQSKSKGVAMTWSELKNFADSLVQTYDSCSIKI